MLTACIGKQEDYRRNPGSAADLQWFSSPCGHTGPPAVVGLPENVLQKRGRCKSVSDSVAEDNPSHRPGMNWRAVTGDPLSGRGLPQPQYRGLSTGCPGAPGVGSCRASVAGS